MEDVIKRSGNTFGTNEAFILTQLSIAAVPTASIIFLDIITNQIPQVRYITLVIYLSIAIIFIKHKCPKGSFPF